MQKKCLAILIGSTLVYASGAAAERTAEPIDTWLNKVNVSTAGANAVDPKLETIKRDIVEFYQRTEITKSFVSHGLTIDCVPFEKQMALIDQSEEFVKQAKQNYQKHGPKEPQDLRCPKGDVLVARPSAKAMNSNDASYFYPKKHKPASNDSKDQLDASSLPNYGWILSGNEYKRLNKDWEVVYSSLSMGANPKIPFSGHTVGHSLGQIWVADGTYNNKYSLESGIIRGSGTPETAFFVFASVDDWGSDSCYNARCGNFIQFPNTAPLNRLISAPKVTQDDGPTDIYTIAFRRDRQDGASSRHNYYYSVSDGIVDPGANKTLIRDDTKGYYDFSLAGIDTSSQEFFSGVGTGGEVGSTSRGIRGSSTWQMGTGQVKKDQQDLNVAAVYAYGYNKGFFTDQDSQTISYMTDNLPVPELIGFGQGQYKGYLKKLSDQKKYPYQTKPQIPETIQGQLGKPLRIMIYGGTAIRPGN